MNKNYNDKKDNANDDTMVILFIIMLMDARILIAISIIMIIDDAIGDVINR